ncbi:phosphate uptake regulator PhoU [Candidatus Woesearchaeota archaeon]|nr:phosphate uptake regulator PhoU [Candidatus Woesearchaeota archaeon]
MKRKVVKLGPATLVVSLPNKWTRKFGIVAGEEVELVEQNRDLLIKTNRDFKVERDVLDFIKIDHLLKRILASRYVRGCEEIEIKFDNLEKSRIIQKRVGEMIGMEIIEQNKDRLLVKDMQGITQDNFDSVLRRVLFLLNSLSDESLKSISNKETDLEYLKDVEKNLNRFSDYCFRLLSKKGYNDYKQTPVWYCIVTLLEDLGDDYKSLISYINDQKIKLSNDLIEIYKKVNSLHGDLTKLFSNFTFEHAVNLTLKRDEIIRDINRKLDTGKSVKETIVLKNFEKISNQIVDIMNQLLVLN